MSEPAAATGDGKAAKKGGKKKLVMLVAAVLLLGGGGAGAWFSGVLPRLLEKDDPAVRSDPHGSPQAAPAAAHGAKPEKAEAGGHGAKAEKAEAGAHGAKPAAHGAKPAEGAKPPDPSSPYMDLPDIVANLNAGPRRTVFVKLRAKLELSRPEDQAAVQSAMPRVLDLFQGYLREMRPEELRGTGGTYRLREELLARTNIAAAPARVVAVLFTEMLVQ